MEADKRARLARFSRNDGMEGAGWGQSIGGHTASCSGWPNGCDHYRGAGLGSVPQERRALNHRECVRVQRPVDALLDTPALVRAHPFVVPVASID